MPTFNVTLKEGSPVAELDKAKQTARTTEGCEIKHEFTLIKGFTVEIPDEHVGVLRNSEHLHVEQDGEVKTQ